MKNLKLFGMVLIILLSTVIISIPGKCQEDTVQDATDTSQNQDDGFEEEEDDSWDDEE